MDITQMYGSVIKQERNASKSQRDLSECLIPKSQGRKMQERKWGKVNSHS